MEDSLNSNNGAAVEIHPNPAATTVEALSHYKLQSGDSVDAFDNSENSSKNAADDAVQENIDLGVVQESDVDEAVLDNKPKMVVPEDEEQTATEKQEEQVKCSEKCPLKIQVIGNGKLNDDQKDGANRNRKPQETEEKKEKKPRRKGGKNRKNKEILNCYSNEKKEKGLQYSRKKMEALRFENMEEQKKKWVEVYCGLGPFVAQEYDGLVDLDKIHQKDNSSSFHFDPRPQFLKYANLGEDRPKFSDNHFENSNTSDDPTFPIGDEIECSVVEEECSQDDDSDEDYSIQKPAFFVTGQPDFESGPPQDGLEYLRRVRWEAARVPKVAVAKFNNKIKEQSNYMPQIPDIAKCPENLLPLKQWEDSFLADFSELRLAFTKLDLQESSIKFQPILEEDIFEKFVTSTSIDDSISETSDANINPDSPRNSNSTVDPPILSMILKMQPAARTSMLKKRISSIENMSKLSHNDSSWLFALCAAIDCPLDADTSAALRSLLRKCAVLRAAKTEVDDEVIVLNILATISGRYFGQLEK